MFILIMMQWYDLFIQDSGTFRKFYSLPDFLECFWYLGGKFTQRLLIRFLVSCALVWSTLSNEQDTGPAVYTCYLSGCPPHETRLEMERYGNVNERAVQ